MGEILGLVHTLVDKQLAYIDKVPQFSIDNKMQLGDANTGSLILQLDSQIPYSTYLMDFIHFLLFYLFHHHELNLLSFYHCVSLVSINAYLLSCIRPHTFYAGFLILCYLASFKPRLHSWFGVILLFIL